MDNNLLVALLIPWVFWGIFMGLLKYAGRSWINLVVIPFGITVVLLLVAIMVSVKEAFWLSVTAHIVFLLLMVASYLKTKMVENKNNKD